MHRLCLYPGLIVVLASIPLHAEEKRDADSAISFAPTDWPWWRGPNRDGIATADQSPPLRWDAETNVVWKTPVPGRGHGSATVVNDQVILAVADREREVQTVLCLDRNTGKPRWESVVHRGGIETKGNKKASQASCSVACDGKRLFVNFLNNGAVFTTALTREGKQLWQQKITDYVVHQGFGSSPAVYDSLVIVSADNKGGGAIMAMDRVTGDVVWRNERPKKPNYVSPIILSVAGRMQLLFIGCDTVCGWDPLTGDTLWQIEGSTTECVTSTVTDGKLVFTSGGYPRNHVSAIRADGSGEIVWQDNKRVYVPSMLCRDGYLYAVTDAAVAICWKSDTGKVMWQQRLRGTFSSSPVMFGDTILVTNESGETFLFKADPSSFEKVGQNKLGSEVFATPTVCGSRIYIRVAEQIDGRRQETLYCLGTMK